MLISLHAAPPAVFYDNACHLHTYALSREAAFFRDCYFGVDAFHVQKDQHKVCSRNYDVTEQPAHCAVNTEACEQWNRFLVNLKPFCSFMKQENFLLMAGLLISYRNML